MKPEKAAQLEYNLAVLKRRDGSITKVLDMSGHVVLYQFNEEKQSWDLKKVEGALFVVQRAAEPKHMFVVLNRLSNDNVVEALTADFQMELTDQFLLYRNDKQEIIGIWFYSTDERAEIAKLLQSIAAAEAPTATGVAPTADATTSAVSEPAAPPPTTSDNVAEFFSRMQNQLPPSSVPPMPTGATEGPTAPLAVTASPQQSEAEAEPTAAPPEVVMAPQATAPPAVTTTPTTATLKRQLRARLAALMDDDVFMDLLVAEVQALQGASAPAASQAPANEMPPHLMELLQQQMAGDWSA